MNLLHRLPAHVINGISVALGVAVIHLVAVVLVGPEAAGWASSGAIFASLADRPGSVSRSWRRVVATGLLGCLAGVLVVLLAEHRLGLGVAIALIAFVATMTLAWGLRAGPMSFVPVLAIVFAMALPDGTPVGPLLLGYVAGAAAYFAWAMATTALLQRRYGTLAVADATQSLAELLRARAAVLDAGSAAAQDAEHLRAWVRQEGALAERLQAARDLVFAAPDDARMRREAALLLRLIDLRDLLIAGLLDLERFDAAPGGPRWRDWLARSLEAEAARLDEAQAWLRGTHAAADAAMAPVGELPLPDVGDSAAASLGAAARNRVRHLRTDTDRVVALARGAEEPLPLTREELRQFVAPEGWPLSVFASHRTLASPVLRYSLRAALALGCAYVVALWLPWASHPQWLVLSVAVVLRGNFEQTLARRNQRVLGTLLGCLVVMLLARWPSPPLMTAAFIVSVGVAHGYAIERYVITALAATVMSLLQAHLANPTIGFPVAERLADTVLGAALAWAFSYVLPAWERRALPRAIERALRALRGYAGHVLGQTADDASVQRIARRQAYDAVVAVGAALQRGAAEPASARPPLAELTRFIDQAQQLMAHLSMVRLLRQRSGLGATDAELGAALRRAQLALQRWMGVPLGEATAPVVASEAALRALPEVPPAVDARPWLLWRLHTTEASAAQTSLAAGDVLAALGARARPAAGTITPP